MLEFWFFILATDMFVDCFFPIFSTILYVIRKSHYLETPFVVFKFIFSVYLFLFAMKVKGSKLNPS